MTNTNKDFLESAKLVHPEKYIYLSEYINYRTKIKIECLLCKNIFYQTPNDHLNGSGCRICGRKLADMKRSKSHYFYITKAKEIFGNDAYEYFLGEYAGVFAKIEILCKKCKNMFYKTYSDHIHNKQGCPKCSLIVRGEKRKNGNDFYLEKSKQLYGELYQYLEEYKTVKDKIKILCTKCEMIFYKNFDNHIHHKEGCPYCAMEQVHKDQTKLHDVFVKEFNIIYSGMFELLGIYKTAHKKIEIKCIECNNIFKRTPNALLMATSKCPSCDGIESFGEKTIRIFLEQNNIKFEPQKTFNECKHISLLRFDFYLSEYNLCIEYQGGQHYKPVRWRGETIQESIDIFELVKIRDTIKKNIVLKPI